MATYIEDFRQGDTKVFVIDYGKGVDITDWKFYFILRDELDDTENALQVMVTAGDNVLDDVANGLVHITVSATESAALTPKKFYYAVKVDKGGTPAVIWTLVPPIEDAKDRVTVVPGIEIV